MNIEFLMLGFSGVLVHYLLRIKEVVEKQTNSELKITSEIPGLLLSIVLTTLLIYVKDDISDFYPITKFTAILAGLQNQAIFNRVVTSRMPGSSIPQEKKMPYSSPGDSSVKN